MSHRLKLAAPIVSARAGLHTDQARRKLREKGEQLAAAKLATDKNSPAMVNTMDLENVLCQVDSNCSKLRHGRLLYSGQRHPNYAGICRRNQEPSAPIENIWQFMRDNWPSNRVFKSYDDIVDHCCHAWRKLQNQPWKSCPSAGDNGRMGFDQ
jgi:hypothetical protein